MDTRPRPLERDFARALKLADRIGASTPYSIVDPQERTVHTTCYATLEEAQLAARGLARAAALDAMRTALRERPDEAPDSVWLEFYVNCHGDYVCSIEGSAEREEVTL